MMKVLAIVPSFRVLGGVANHYIGLTPHWRNDFRYVTCGRRRHFPAVLTLVPDWIALFVKILLFRPDVVVVNNSFKTEPLYRDGVNILIARMLRRKVVTFIHGWDENVYNSIKKKPALFRMIYNKSSFIYVLYSRFKTKLEQLGINTQINLTTTKVADELVDDYEPKLVSKANSLLFLARVDYDKGLDITLKAFKQLHEKYHELKLIVCGTGPYLEEAKKWVDDEGLQNNVDFKGFVDGKQKIDCFKNSEIYILPTTHGEGMATSVLEAMAMGLVVVSRPVGGVADFFEQGKMGFLLESIEPQNYVDVIETLITDRETLQEISEYNHKYAKSHFMASTVASAIERDLESVIL